MSPEGLHNEDSDDVDGGAYGASDTGAAAGLDCPTHIKPIMHSRYYYGQ